ncbi:hypothetical protein [Chloroflexus aggregans]|uniref:Uncharacterized protein n=1 Tax=Chloroflexus aggregans (strain MD-66 / DSM 9485) TaxID=326427 RepID=B8G536_CHLAD|nr:hypothetical protein [Chloroflexus aggregans]ACL23669.1 conserved hypothetical protein [Chloroflexus aggregans DSM 9485]
MPITLIGEFEVSYHPDATPALILHHLIRGYDAVVLNADEVVVLRELLSVVQKRIREVGHYRLILGAGGDLTFYTASGQRSAYLTADQMRVLARLIGATPPHLTEAEVHQ